MSPSSMIAAGLFAWALQSGAAIAQYKYPPGGLPGATMPAPSMPAPSMPSTMPSPPPMPSIQGPPQPSVPDVRAPVIVVPPPPPKPDRSRDGGDTQECDCYRTIDGKRVYSGRNVACCPK